nr:DUF3744 domain-containing protein [Alloiococcus otitis]
MEKNPHNLSGGQKQRVSIGGVLVNDIPILLFDEPLANLDPASGEGTIELINRLNKELGVTVVIIEHRLEECLLAGIDQVILLNEGKLVSNTSVSDLLKTDLLSQVGLRQPLYIQALKYAGVDINEIESIGHYRKTTIDPNYLNKVEKWAQSIHRNDENNCGEIILKTENLTYQYPNQATPVLQNISFEIRRGDKVSLVGSNGAGKSTLAKVICGFLRPKKGTIAIMGQDISNYSIKEIADRVGYVMQNPNSMISQNLIFDEVALGLKNRGIASDEIIKRVHETLRICGLYPMRNWPISALSYGQKRRVTIASILVLEPQILILDEPTAGQDYYNYTQFMTFVDSLNRDQNLTILMITHDMHLMQEYTGRSLVFNQGHLLADTTPAVILSNHRLMTKSDLVPTSLYYLGQDLTSLTTEDFIQKFMDYESKVIYRESS